MVAEPGGTDTVVHAVDRQGDRQVCRRLVEEGEVARAIVGLVRAGAASPGRLPAPAGRTGHARYQLIVEVPEGGAPAVVLDIVTVPPAGSIGRQDTRRGRLVGRVRAFIESHLGDPELTPAAVAAAHHISLRYLHKLFEPEVHGVAGLIRQRRLERCRHDLLDPSQTDRPVAGIAARWGFSSAAHFSRVFREAYGLPPAEFRRAIRLGAAS